MNEPIQVYICKYQKDFSLPDHFRWPVSAFSPEVAGFDRFFRVVDEPALADFLLFPYYLTPMIQQIGIAATRTLLRCILTDFPANEGRYIFFNYEDLSEPLDLDAVIFQISMNRQRHDRYAIAYPYPVDEPAVDDNLFFEDIFYHTSFVGYPGSHPVREKMADMLSRVNSLQMYVETVPFFHGHLNEHERLERQAHFSEIMWKSLTVLCPRGAAENSVRFFETLARGRIPVLISDHAVLPMESVIPYQDFVIRVMEDDIDKVADHILSWLASRTALQVKQACLQARQVWLDWLQPGRLPAFVAHELFRLKQEETV